MFSFKHSAPATNIARTRASSGIIDWWLVLDNAPTLTPDLRISHRSSVDRKFSLPERRRLRRQEAKTIATSA